jgi:hypothetical protein
MMMMMQIDDILADSNRVIEKSRMPRAESTRKRLRLRKEDEGEDEGEGEDSSSDSEEEEYDLEVYDDRHFYSQLLKVSLSTLVFRVQWTGGYREVIGWL